MFALQNVIPVVFMACLMLHIVEINAQRPSYAGSRPGGLNQKDKYHTPQQSTNDVTTNVTNRFGNNSGNVATNQIPFGAVQKPPMSGLPIVTPQTSYQPLPGDAVGVDNRFGNANPSAGSNPTTQQQPAAPLPFDAHGDRELINYLNTLPVEKRPFWFLNYQAIEAQRNGNNAGSSGAVSSRGSFFG